ncbi:baseplate J/gp47 family protein [Leptospirillum ferriphilum]|uniref:baseplate J/gp47 family protein n=1 Tax=Leptospirillum ferriphilum TaxID=178606 RepID=UPI00098769DC|nr:baseplate J/gp47 family protein [Leptospirillum ferriphilum]OOH80797.1 hypothetical protein BOX30_05520 [Leptospirillum ferriphilum]
MNILTLSQLTQNILNAIQSKVQKVLDFTIGSIWVALAESQSQTAMWLQSLILQVLAWTRAQTSTGSALDLWLAQFGFTRLPGVVASGSVTVGANVAPTSPITVAAGGMTVQTISGVQFVNSAGFTLEAGQTSVSVPVAAVLSGTTGNVAAGTITQFVTPIPGIDTVTNPTAFTNGVNPESDAAVRSRFITYISSIQKGTKLAVQAAISGVQQGLTYNLVEFETQAGVATPAYFYAVVNDGSGNPPSTLLNTIANAIDAVVAAGIQFNVYGPTATTVNIAFTLTVLPGYQFSSVSAAVQSAITSYINGLGIGGTLYWSELYGIAYGVAGVQEVTGMTANGGTSDIAAGTNGVLVAGTFSITQG